LRFEQNEEATQIQDRMAEVHPFEVRNDAEIAKLSRELSALHVERRTTWPSL
jgi:hypothetical protein